MADKKGVVNLDESKSDASEQLHETLAELTKLMKMQSKSMQSFVKLMSDKAALDAKDAKSELIESLCSRIDVFHFEPKDGLTFETWYRRYVNIFTEDTKSLDDAAKVRLLLERLDSVAHDRYLNYILPDEPKKKTFKETVEILNKLFRIPESQFCRRWKCLQSVKKETETYTEYTARMNKLCEDFNLKTMTADEFKCLMFLVGLKNSKDAPVRSKLHSKLEGDHATGMTLVQLGEEAERLINVKKDTRLGTSDDQSAVRAVHTPKKFNGQPKSRSSRGPNNSGKSESAKNSAEVPRYPCWRCGGMHFNKNCAFITHKCDKCAVVGHKEGYCNVHVNKPKKAINVIKLIDNSNSSAAVGHANIGLVSSDHITPGIITSAPDGSVGSSDPHAEHVFSTQVNAVKNTGERKFVAVQINGQNVVFQLDSGADMTLITKQTWEDLGCPPLEVDTRASPVDAQNNKIHCHGVMKASIAFQGQRLVGNIVVSSVDTNLFGNDYISLFDLWSRAPNSYCLKIRKEESFDIEAEVSRFRENFDDVFSPTLGKCSMGNAKIHLKDGASPVFRPKRPIPLRIKSRVEEELERLQMANIIEPIDSSEFAAPIVIVQKANGSLRICADYSTGLNAVVLPHEYPIPTPDSIFSDLSNSRIFSQIDLKDAYLQIPVDKESSKMLAINTHRGLFAVNRLYPGVKPAAGIFQQIMDKIFVGMECVKVYFDDILVKTATVKEHITALNEVFIRLRKYNVRASWMKCKFFQEEIKFLGIIVSGRGMRPDPAKIEAIVSMPPPENQSQLHSFLGAIGFYMKFVKSMSVIREPLDKLMKKDTPFYWSPECNDAFEKFKTILQSELLLVHYNPDLPITIAADASQYGIGAVALHSMPDGSQKAFYHISRRLTPAECNYAQIEKEALAIVFAIKKFHKYIWGHKFFLHTDHKPLLAIFNPMKGIPQHTASRLQRWALVLMAYDFDIAFVRTQDFGHADVLSRLIANRTPEDFVVAAVRKEEAIGDVYVDSCNSQLPVSFQDIGIATDQDAELSKLREIINNGWPPSTKAISGDLRKYFSLKDSLSLIQNVITFRDRTIIPAALRSRILDHLHESHPGSTRMKSLARGYVFWPRIDHDIEDVVSKCQPCREVAKAPVKAQLASWPVPAGPWQRVHADYLGPWRDRMFLVIVDAYSKWPEVFQMSRTTTSATVDKFNECISRFGSMLTLVTDNGPQFASAEFQEFCSLNCITHLTSPPYHPQSNGQAESFVGHLKRTLSKEDFSMSYLQLFLRNHRATRGPHTPTGESPAELMLGRQIRLPLASVLPPVSKTLLPNSKMEQQFNRQYHTTDRSFEEGDAVTIRPSPKSKWIVGTVVERQGAVRYVVKTGPKRVHIVHVNQMRPSKISLEEEEHHAPVAPPSPPVLRKRRI